jgi:hypothetical protein
MYGSRYAFVNDLEQLKTLRPQRRLVAQGPDLTRFLTGNTDLEDPTNFGAEMFKLFSLETTRALADPTNGLGGGFKNLDFTPDASEWNHIMEGSRPDPSADAVANQAYFVNDILTRVGSSWPEVKALLSRPPLQGKSYYQIVMDGSYRSLSPRDAFLFLAAITETRGRVIDMYNRVFGPVSATRNDHDMMQYIDRFVETYGSGHAISLFESFLPLAHLFTDQMTAYYEKNLGDGIEGTGPEQQRFWAFSQYMGRTTFDALKLASTPEERANLERTSASPLYQFRGSITDSRSTAVSDLLNLWFGATEPESGQPIWEGYRSAAERTLPGADDPNLVTLNSRLSFRSTGGFTGVAEKAYVPTLTNPANGWDRKWSPDLAVESGGHVYWVDSNDASWAQIMHQLWHQGSVQSYINPDINPGSISDPTQRAMLLPFYSAAQMQSSWSGSFTTGEGYDNNWVIHAMGQLKKHGQFRDLSAVTTRMQTRRAVSFQYRADTSDYAEKKLELEAEKIAEQKAAGQAQSNKKAAAKRPAAKSTNEAEEYRKALEKMRMRILSYSKKQRQMIDQNKK